MTPTIAIKSFLEAPPNGAKVQTNELLEFKKSCTKEEWNKMGKDAAEAIGKLEQFKPDPVEKEAGVAI